MAGKRTKLSILLDRLSPPEGVLLLILAVIIGGLTGLAAVYFIRLIMLVQTWSYSALPELLPFPGYLLYLVVPVLGGLLAGPLVHKFAKEAKGHGVPEVMQALLLHGGRIRPRVAIAKIAASALCIGTGGSAGREGPIVQVGSALGSSIGQFLRLSDERVRNLVACGAAAGIAATFNAPIAGVAFAIEVFMSELQVRMFGNVVIASVSAAIVSQAFLGDRPAFTPPSFFMAAPSSIIFYLILGLASALVAVAFIRLLSWFEIKFEALRFPSMFKPALGGLLLGLLGLGFMYVQAGGEWWTPSAGSSSVVSLEEHMPSVYGSGFVFIEKVLQGRIDFWFLLLLVLLKPLATSFTLGSGNSGGVFAPSLFIGAMLGGALGELFGRFFPVIAGPPGAYALVGMAAVFAAAARAPLTSMLIVFEMTNDYSMILPLMAAAVTASYFAQFLYPESIYTSKLARRGIRFAQGRDLDVMQGVVVGEVMKRSPITVAKDLTLDELERKFTTTRFLGFPVLDELGELYGIVTLQDIQKVLSHSERKKLSSMCVADIAITEVVTVYPDEPVWTAIQKMAPRDLARLPVIARGEKGEFLGIISRSEILRAYEVAIVKKQRGLMLEKTVSLRDEGEAVFCEFHIKNGSGVVGRQVSRLGLPDTVNVVSVARKGETVIPSGSTSFEVGDVVTLFGTRNSLERMRSLFTEQQA